MRAINLLIKPASSLCNLRCRYCFYEDEAQNRTQHSMGIMKEEMAEKLIRQCFEAVDANGYVSFAFQGGEPTVAGLDYFRHFTAMVNKYRPETVQIHYAIQTNGTLLDEEWVKFLKENDFLVGLSLDGIRTVHESLRIDADGQGTWARVQNAKALLERYQVDYNALCVVTKEIAAAPDQAYKRLKLLGFEYMQFIACLDPIGKPRGQEPWSLTPEAYGKFLCRVFDLWYQDWASGQYHSVRLFDDYVHTLLGDGASTCSTCGKCGTYLVLEGDGSGYPCDFFCIDEWRVGSLNEMHIKEMIQSEKAQEFLRWGITKPKECADCPYGHICNGGCKNDWYLDETGPHNYFCSSFRALLDHGLERMRAMAQAERAAALQYRPR